VWEDVVVWEVWKAKRRRLGQGEALHGGCEVVKDASQQSIVAQMQKRENYSLAQFCSLLRREDCFE
jgi:hypothetical protein